MLFAVGKYKIGELNPQCARIATVFSGGVGGSHQEMCGGLTGGLLIIGSLFGRIDLKGDDVKVQALGKDFRQRFLDEFGTTKCKEIKEWLKLQGKPDQCDIVVEKSALILLELLEGEEV